MIVLGAGILAFGLYNVHSRSMISEGGVLGLSLLLYQWFSLSPSITSFVMDSLAILLGTLILQNRFLFDSIFASVCYSVLYASFEKIGPILPDYSASPLMAALVGGIFVGVGTSFIVRYGCAAGADDSLALIFQKLTKIRLSVFYVLSDFFVLTLSLSYIPIEQIGWSFLSVLLSSALITLFCPKQEESKRLY